MKYIKRIICLILGISMVSCHTLFTAPVLWNHGSSSAFNAAGGIYFLIFVVSIWIWLIWDDKK